MKITQINKLPDDFDNLVKESLEEGYHFLLRMDHEWKNSKNRFDKENEILFSVLNDNQILIGIGGLNLDPYSCDPSAGRIRHVYISPSYRGRGFGKALLSKIITHGKIRFKSLSLKTDNSKAIHFYQSFGFQIDESVSDDCNFVMVLYSNKLV